MKKILLRFCICCALMALHFCSIAQDSSHIQISLLTCGPGLPNDELYTTFGHSALRIIDSSSVTDVVYNYGTFDEFEENFYLKFIKGKLKYFVSVENFSDFKNAYQADNRSITEQVLNIPPAKKIIIQHFLNNNLLPANKYYTYDFCLDNCTTRLRDILKNNFDSSFIKTPVMPTGTTFRNAIHQCLNNNHKLWSKLGIDILLGKPCDAIMTPEQMQFLPKNLLQALDSTTSAPLILHKNLYSTNTNISNKLFFTPFLFFSFLLLAVILISFLKNKFVQKVLHGFDGLLFFAIGLLGVVLIFMWWATDHSMTKNNFNLLWAWPTHTFFAFFVNSKKTWVKKYFAFVAMASLLLLVVWSFLPQALNTDLIPLILLVIYRSLSKATTTAKLTKK